MPLNNERTTDDSNKPHTCKQVRLPLFLLAKMHVAFSFGCTNLPCTFYPSTSPCHLLWRRSAAAYMVGSLKMIAHAILSSCARSVSALVHVRVWVNTLGDPQCSAEECYNNHSTCGAARRMHPSLPLIASGSLREHITHNLQGPPQHCALNFSSQLFRATKTQITLSRCSRGLYKSSRQLS